MAELALGAVHSLLGLLRDEAQRLGRVQGDVQFIKEEMESMNSFLLHLASSVPPDGEHDEQVRSWMKQVRDLAFDCSTCIDMYVQWHQGPEDPRGAVSLRVCVLWVPWLVRSLFAQHRAASQLRMLKERAREVGERRQRYGVEVPKPKADGDEKKQDSGTGGWSWAPPSLPSSFRADAAGGAGEDDLSNLESSISLALDCGVDSAPPILEECTEKLLEWLKKEPAPEFEDWPRVMAVDKAPRLHTQEQKEIRNTKAHKYYTDSQLGQIFYIALNSEVQRQQYELQPTKLPKRQLKTIEQRLL